MGVRDVVDAGSGSRDGVVTDSVRAVLGSVPVVPGARRWWVESIPQGFELHGEVGGTAHDVPGTRETRIAVGAGLFAAHLAVAARGTRPVTTLLPRSARPGLLAVVRRGDERPPTPVERTLHVALRGGAGRAPAPVPVLRRFLRLAADAEGTWLRSAVGNGGRTTPRGLLVDAPDARTDVPDEVLLVLLAAARDLPLCQLRAGRAFERVLLTASVLGHVARVLAGPGGLDPTPRALRSAGVDPAVTPYLLLSVAPRG
ncbi:hypothetical protein [Pseudonocardia humida]|uniref:Nitroreductase family protein n=1 Tax=Pseudonocardia humida TaxID=2800819 RepID=A0ABT1A0D1_9PSEU|nr:hypothetical protein [Pseudonocardia humida]MCO1656339.1 hypothetical protein [Pseudonocardia humida]